MPSLEQSLWMLAAAIALAVPVAALIHRAISTSMRTERLAFNCPCGKRTEVDLEPDDLAEVIDSGTVACSYCERWTYDIRGREWMNWVTGRVLKAHYPLETG